MTRVGKKARPGTGLSTTLAITRKESALPMAAWATTAGITGFLDGLESATFGARASSAASRTTSHRTS